MVSGIVALTIPEISDGGHFMMDMLDVAMPSLGVLVFLLVLKYLFSMFSFSSGAPGGIFLPILVLGAVTETDAAEGVSNNLIQTVCSPEMVQWCEQAASEAKKQTEVHLKIDTGMGRIGVRNEPERDDKAAMLSFPEHLLIFLMPTGMRTENNTPGNSFSGFLNLRIRSRKILYDIAAIQQPYTVFRKCLLTWCGPGSVCTDILPFRQPCLFYHV